MRNPWVVGGEFGAWPYVEADNQAIILIGLVLFIIIIIGPQKLYVLCEYCSCSKGSKYSSEVVLSHAMKRRTHVGIRFVKKRQINLPKTPASA